MHDNQCVRFLQWALPQLNMRWPGFRRVRRQVCRRVDKRLRQLQFDDIDAYRHYLTTHPDEWTHLDNMCRITISRFYRDRAVFDVFATDLLPELLQDMIEKNNATLKIWSCGCASGEEPYTVAIIWHYMYSKAYPGFQLEITATDIDPVLIERAHKACYPENTLRFLPNEWKSKAFSAQDNTLCLHENLKKYVRFKLSDIRTEFLEGSFQIVFCRNLAFTYFDRQVQEHVLSIIANVLEPGGILIVGKHEQLEIENQEFALRDAHLPIYRKNTS